MLRNHKIQNSKDSLIKKFDKQLQTVYKMYEMDITILAIGLGLQENCEHFQQFKQPHFFKDIKIYLLFL